MGGVLPVLQRADGAPPADGRSQPGEGPVVHPPAQRRNRVVTTAAVRAKRYVSHPLMPPTSISPLSNCTETNLELEKYILTMLLCCEKYVCAYSLTKHFVSDIFESIFSSVHEFAPL